MAVELMSTTRRRTSRRKSRCNRVACTLAALARLRLMVGVNIVKHIDDSATSGTPEELDKLAVDLGKGMSLRCTGTLLAHGKFADQDWQNFLSRERKREGATLIKRPKQKFVE